MKIRQGFVSNSSSSSFIAAGVKFTKEEFKELQAKYDNIELNQFLYDELCDGGFAILHGTEGGLKNNDEVVIANDIWVVSSENSYLPPSEYFPDELPDKYLKAIAKIDELKKEFGLTERTKIYQGTRMS